jgi:cell division protein FtsQ
MPAIRHARKGQANRQAPRRSPARAPYRRTDGHAWTMKLGAWAHARMRQAQHDNTTRKVLIGATVVSVVAILLVLASGLGVLDNIGRSISASAANGARSMGLAVRVVNIQAPLGVEMSEYQRAEAQAIAGIIPEEVMFSVDPKEIRARVSDLPWVESVTVRRLWPDQVQIVITPRAATALWQENGKLAYMDGAGRRLGPARVTSAKGLALVVGKNAGPASPALFAALTPHKEVAARTVAAIRIDDRRWNLRTKAGGDILLPEANMEQALAQLNQLASSHKLLDRPFARLDMRTPGTLIVRPMTEVISVSMPQDAVKSARGVQTTAG